MHIVRSIASVGPVSVARAGARSACAALVLSVLAGCGSAQKPPEPAPAAEPQATVFDDLTRKEKELPAAVEASQQQHMDDVHRQVDDAEGGGPAPDSGTPR